MRGRRLRICLRSRRQTSDLSEKSLSTKGSGVHRGRARKTSGAALCGQPKAAVATSFIFRLTEVRCLRSTLWFLRRPQQNLTHERLRSLCHDRCNRMCNIVRLQHLVRVFSRVRTEFGVD